MVLLPLAKSLFTEGALVPSSIDVTYLSKKDKKRFAAIFQKLDSLLTQLKAFTRFEGKSIEDYGITQKEYEDYAAHYHNVIEELRADRDDDGSGSSDMPLNTEYEPLAYSRVKIDYEYIINLIQDIVSNMNDETDEEEFKAKVEEIRGYIKEFSAGNETLGGTRAIALYREKGEEAVLEEYGIARTTLRDWLKEAGIHLNSPKYSAEFKAAAVAMTEEKPLTTVAKELGISASTLATWKTKNR